MSIAAHMQPVAKAFYTLLYMSLTAAAAGGVLLAVRRLADRRIPPFWKCAMWGVMLLALILPFRPQSGMSLTGGTEAAMSLSMSLSYRQDYAAARQEYVDAEKAATSQEASDISHASDSEGIRQLEGRAKTLKLKTIVFDLAIPMLWLSGSLLVATFFLACQAHVRAGIRKGESCPVRAWKGT